MSFFPNDMNPDQKLQDIYHTAQHRQGQHDIITKVLSIRKIEQGIKTTKIIGVCDFKMITHTLLGTVYPNIPSFSANGNYCLSS